MYYFPGNHSQAFLHPESDCFNAKPENCLTIVSRFGEINLFSERKTPKNQLLQELFRSFHAMLKTSENSSPSKEVTKAFVPQDSENFHPKMVKMAALSVKKMLETKNAKVVSVEKGVLSSEKFLNR